MAAMKARHPAASRTPCKRTLMPLSGRPLMPMTGRVGRSNSQICR
jgi:hypothetical protein